MATTNAIDRVTASGQKRFIGTLLASAMFFAVGFSVTLFGVSSPYLATTMDKLGVVATGLVLLGLGCAGAYSALA